MVDPHPVADTVGDEPPDDFARLYAQTQRFTLGEPRNLALFDSFVLFVRSDSGVDATHHLWIADLDSGTETKLIDVHELGRAAEGDLPAAERARRERLREGGAGITSFATDHSGTLIAFALNGHLFTADLDLGSDAGQADRAQPDPAPRVPLITVQAIDTDGAVFDPRPSPDGQLIAFVSGQRLVVIDRDGSRRADVGSDDPDVSWGGADFIAAEEMGRYRGFWWSPDSDALAVCRNDIAAVQQWWISEPADPSAEPVLHRYPQAGTPNPSVELYVVQLGEPTDNPADPIPVSWDRSRFEYLASVSWTAEGFVIAVQTRDQRRVAWYNVESATGDTEQAWEDDDPHWVELVPGSGVARTDPDGSTQLVAAGDRDGARRLVIDGSPVTPADLQLRSIISVDAQGVLLTANPIDDSTVVHLYRWSETGFEALTTEPGLHSAVGRSQWYAVRRATVEHPGAAWTLPGGHRLASVAATPPVVPRPLFSRSGEYASASVVLLPHDHDGSPLPVLVDPYGGPHALRVVRSYQALSSSQWFADQGFAVVITDGRGTPGRGSAYERAVAGDLAWGVLDDQVAGLHDAAARVECLDLDRVAIRGWSFGGYLAALAVLARPDVFHVGVAGAPVTEWRWYDTHYTERYLGNPVLDAEPYDRCSLIGLAPKLERPLLLIHGLADDNVVAAHSLALSSALLAAGRPHEVLPLSGVTHMTPQVDVARNLLLHQLEFIRRQLPPPPKD